MFCPACGQEQISSQVRFCSKCGFPLSEVSLILANGGKLLKSQEASPRKKGVKQGVFMLLLTFLVVPIVAIITSEIGLGEILVPISAVLLFMGGILRIIYAAMFEPSLPLKLSESSQLSETEHQMLNQTTLSPISISDDPYLTIKKDTSELIPPPSVTEETTRKLEIKAKKSD